MIAQMPVLQKICYHIIQAIGSFLLIYIFG